MGPRTRRCFFGISSPSQQVVRFNRVDVGTKAATAGSILFKPSFLDWCEHCMNCCRFCKHELVFPKQILVAQFPQKYQKIPNPQYQNHPNAPSKCGSLEPLSYFPRPFPMPKRTSLQSLISICQITKWPLPTHLQDSLGQGSDSRHFPSRLGLCTFRVSQPVLYKYNQDWFLMIC